MSPQLIGLLALLVASALLLLLVLVQRHQRRSRRQRAAALGLQPSPSGRPAAHQTPVSLILLAGLSPCGHRAATADDAPAEQQRRPEAAERALPCSRSHSHSSRGSRL